MFFNFINHYVNYFANTLFNKNKNYYNQQQQISQEPHYTIKMDG